MLQTTEHWFYILEEDSVVMDCVPQEEYDSKQAGISRDKGIIRHIEAPFRMINDGKYVYFNVILTKYFSLFLIGKPQGTVYVQPVPT